MATVEGLDAKLDMLIKGLDEFKADIKDRFKCVNEDINGNGKPGLKADVKELKITVAELAESQKQDDADIKKIKEDGAFTAWLRGLFSNPKTIAAIITIVLGLLGTSGTVAFNKLNDMEKNFQKVEKVVEKIQTLEVAP